MIRGLRFDGTFRSIETMPNVHDLLPGDHLGQLRFGYDEGTVLDDSDDPVSMEDLRELRGRAIRLTVEVLDG